MSKRTPFSLFRLMPKFVVSTSVAFLLCNKFLEWFINHSRANYLSHSSEDRFANYIQKVEVQSNLPDALKNRVVSSANANVQWYTLEQWIDASYDYHETANTVPLNGVLEALQIQLLFGYKPDPQKIIIDPSGDNPALCVIDGNPQYKSNLLGKEHLLTILGSFLDKNNAYTPELAKLIGKYCQRSQVENQRWQQSVRDMYQQCCNNGTLASKHVHRLGLAQSSLNFRFYDASSLSSQTESWSQDNHPKIEFL